MKGLVPIIFTEEVVDAIRLMISMRREVGISMDNEYVFTSITSNHRLRGWDTLQSITKKINLQKPKLVTPTRTRKHLSTVLQLLDMTDSELTWVTNHFGHTQNVHKNWYRPEDSTIELTKVAKVLVAVDSDDSRNIQNKKIDELLEEIDESKKFDCLSYVNITDFVQAYFSFRRPFYILVRCMKKSGTGSYKE